MMVMMMMVMLMLQVNRKSDRQLNGACRIRQLSGLSRYESSSSHYSPRVYRRQGNLPLSTAVNSDN